MKATVRCLIAIASTASITCLPESVTDDHLPLVKRIPISVSSDAAWSLFDRSIESGFAAPTAPVTVKLDEVTALAAIKVYGPAPYELRVTGSAGTSLGFDRIDLSGLSRGWHAFPASTPSRVDVVELHFEPTGGTGAVPEIELWGFADTPADNPTRMENALPPPPASGKLPGGSSVTFTYDGIDRLTRAAGKAPLAQGSSTTYDQTFAYSASHRLLNKQRVHLLINSGGNAQPSNATSFSSAYTYGAARPHLPLGRGEARARAARGHSDCHRIGRSRRRWSPRYSDRYSAQGRGIRAKFCPTRGDSASLLAIYVNVCRVAAAARKRGLLIESGRERLTDTDLVSAALAPSRDANAARSLSRF